MWNNHTQTCDRQEREKRREGRDTGLQREEKEESDGQPDLTHRQRESGISIRIRIERVDMSREGAKLDRQRHTDQRTREGREGNIDR